MSYCKKLIEVALTLDDLNPEAAREKSIRPRHPSTLHLWWSRKLLQRAELCYLRRLLMPLPIRRFNRKGSTI